MENRVDWRMADKFPGLTRTPSPDPTIRSTATDDSDLLQVMKAVEAAEATIKQQVEENIRLRSELENRTLELHRHRKVLESSPVVPPPSSSLDPVANSETSSQPAVDNGDYDLPQVVGSGENSAVVVKVYENEEEIMQLRRQLADYSSKEAKIRHDKFVLESRIANMRFVFDQQQQDLADAACKAMLYRQDIIEENIRLAYALQDVQQERTTFVSALLPILTDYSLQPQVHDAQSIASNVKILFRHLQEKLIMTETKSKQFQYQVRPLQSNSNQSSMYSIQQSAAHSIGAASEISNKDGLEMVTHPPPPSHEKTPASPAPDSPHPTQTAGMSWDQSSGHGSGSGGVDTRNMEHSEPENRNFVSRAVTTKPTIARLAANRYRDDTPPGKQVKFREPEMQTNIEYDDHEEEYNESGGTSPYYPSSSYPQYLSPVHEDLFLEDDPLPAIEGLQISGKALPGHELQASGYSINGTTTCNFEWVRHLPDGSVNYIEGAKQPNYLLTADDVDTYLAIEVQPLDDMKRKGELVKVFANDHKKITCDPEMQSQIQKILQKGHGSFKVFDYAGYLDLWEPATLVIKRGAYSIKRSSESSVGVTEKFSPNTFVSIPYGSPSEFMITDSDISGANADHLLKTDDTSCSRDTVVLILRLFILRAVERRTRKGKKRVLFF